jgi:hypothetical protein
VETSEGRSSEEAESAVLDEALKEGTPLSAALRVRDLPHPRRANSEDSDLAE